MISENKSKLNKVTVYFSPKRLKSIDESKGVIAQASFVRVLLIETLRKMDSDAKYAKKMTEQIFGNPEDNLKKIGEGNRDVNSDEFTQALLEETLKKMKSNSNFKEEMLKKVSNAPKEWKK